MARSLFARLHRKFRPQAIGLTRREMLRTTAAVGAGLLLRRVPAFAEVPPAGKRGRVVVVGAGFGGLACGYELKKAGFEVTVIEARSRIGGRVLSFGDFAAGRNVEGGGELIGSNHPAWVAYAERFGLEFLDVTEDESLESPVVIDGKEIKADEQKRLFEEMETALASVTADAADVDAEEPWNLPNAEALDRRSVEEWIRSLKCSQLCRQAITLQLTADNAVEASKQSYLAHLAMVKGGGLEKFWTESEVYRCKGGNQQLAKALAREIGEEHIQKGRAVTGISLHSEKVVVECAEARPMEADDCVLTVPPTVWDRIKFDPPIPAVLKPQTGTAVKYLSSLKKRFWKDHGQGPDAFTDGNISMTWDATDNQPGDTPAAMVAFSGGPAAERCLSFEKERVDPMYRAELERLYHGFGDNFTASRFMDWPRDPWTMTGYSFPAPGQVTKVLPLLARGLGDRLHFAGEHACCKFAGYMEGALQSGIAAAQRISVLFASRVKKK